MMGLGKMDQSSFCPAPWFQIRNQNLGDLRPCCVIDPDSSIFQGQKNFNAKVCSIQSFMDSEWLQYLRRALISGERPAECHRCWKKEENGIFSERLLLNEKLKIDQWAPIYFQKRGTELWSVMSADWKHNNICNLGCVMCNPTDSSVLYSLWMKNQNHPVVQKESQKFSSDWQKIVDIFTEDTQQNLLDQILNQSNLRWLKISGGEPLIQKNLIDKLKNLPIEKKKQIHLHFITNGTQNLDRTVKQLADYREITFSISIDGTGPVQEWIRPGANWDDIEANVLEIKNRYPIYVHCVLQLANLPRFYNLWNWCFKHNLPLDVELLSNPDSLSIGVITTENRVKYLDEIEKNLNSYKILSHDQSSLDFRLIRKQILEIPYDPDMITKFKEYVDFHDSSNGSNRHDILGLTGVEAW